MGVLDEFDRMWCSARALFGDPAPVGAALSRPLPAVPPAGAAHGWHGDGADRYRVEAGVHRRTLVSVGALDSAADRDVLTALATAERSWACSTPLSSSTSSSPARTFAPDSKAICLTVPATSALSMTP